jgi:hypothetical protein
MEERTVEQIQLETIQELKAKMDAMIDPEEHAKLKTQYDTLLKSMINKRPAPEQNNLPQKSANELAKEIIENKPVSNREYVKRALDYREAMIREYGKDPFTDGKTDVNEINKTVEALQYLVEDSDNDSDFRYKFDQIVKDDPQIAQMLKAKKKGGK